MKVTKRSEVERRVTEAMRMCMAVAIAVVAASMMVIAMMSSLRHALPIFAAHNRCAIGAELTIHGCRARFSLGEAI